MDLYNKLTGTLCILGVVAFLIHSYIDNGYGREIWREVTLAWMNIVIVLFLTNMVVFVIIHLWRM